MESKHHILTGLTLITVIALATTFATGQVTTQDSGEYNLSVTTNPPSEVRETEANFSATVNEVDSNFDAALVYWNYSQDSSLNQKGPASIAFSSGETVEALGSGLSPDTTYDMEAYAEPIVWNDTTLLDNFVQKGLDTSRNSVRLIDDIVGSDDAMEGISESTYGKTVLFKNSYTNEVWSNKRVSKFFEPRFPQDFPHFTSSILSPQEANVNPPNNNVVLRYDFNDDFNEYDQGHQITVNLDNYNELEFYTKNDGYFDEYMDIRVYVDGNEELRTDYGITNWEKKTVDLSRYSGKTNISFNGYSFTGSTGEGWITGIQLK